LDFLADKAHPVKGRGTLIITIVD